MKEEKHPGGRLAKAVRVETGWAGEGGWGRGRRREEETKRKGTQVPQYRDFILVCFFLLPFTVVLNQAQWPLTHCCEPLSGRQLGRMVGSYRAPPRVEGKSSLGRFAYQNPNLGTRNTDFETLF